MYCKRMGAGSNPTGGIFLLVLMSHRFSFFWVPRQEKKSISPIFWVVTLGGRVSQPPPPFPLQTAPPSLPPF